jgi:hypothetical protein
MNDEEIAKEKLEIVANTTDLDTAIKRLERKSRLLEEDMKEDMHSLLENLKPANILRATLDEVQESTPLKHNLLKIAVGLGAGYFSRKMVIGKSAGFVKKALGTALQYGITQFVARRNNNNNNDNDHSIEYVPKKKNLLKRIFSI